MRMGKKARNEPGHGYGADPRTFRQTREIYMVWKRPDGMLVPLNRRYKGIGIAPAHEGAVRDWCDWDALAGFKISKPLTPELVDWIVAGYTGHQFKEGGDRFYLYGDGCQPDLAAEFRRAYDVRVDRLKSLAVDPAEFHRAMQPQPHYSGGELIAPAT